MSDAGGGGDARPYRRGVGIFLLHPDRLVFVARRIDMPQGGWQMPQGGIDPGEDARRSALRELKEEIGTDHVEIIGESRGWLSYDLPGELADRAWNGRYRGQRQKWFAMNFLGADDDIDLETADPEFDAWKWVEARELARFIVPFKRSLYQAVVAEFAERVSAP